MAYSFIDRLRLFVGSVWWPFFVVVFYIMAPLPTLIANRYMDQYEAGNAVKDFALFVTAVLVVSAFGLPIILARAPIAQPIVSIVSPLVRISKSN